MNSCNSCKSPTIAKSSCGTNYCSKQCYNNDWPNLDEARSSIPSDARDWSPFLSDQFHNDFSSDITFQPINRSNYQTAMTLCISPQQEKYVGTISEGLVDSIFAQWKPLLVMLDATPIGFIAYSVTSRVFHLHRFFIDCGFQGRGFGKQTLFAVEHMLAKQLGAISIYLSVHPEAEAAIRIYKNAGFSLLGDGISQLFNAIKLIE